MKALFNSKIYTITPLFSKGAYDLIPEIRPPSIRGQLHEWFRLLGNTRADENKIFGSIRNNDTGSASAIVVRVSDMPVPAETAYRPQTLPHKVGRPSAPKPALRPGTTFTLKILERQPGIPNQALRDRLLRTVRFWLLAGGLGLRCNRGGGSLHIADAPATLADYRTELQRLSAGAPLLVDVLQKAYADPEAARKDITNTLGGPFPPPGALPLAQLKNPLGGVGEELAHEFHSRKTSPLKLRVAKIGNAYHIVAVWDKRTAVTCNTHQHLRRIIDLLQQHNKPLGTQLQKSALYPAP